MMPRDDFESRLGQGLKRWAQAGEPTLDLEALVRERAGLGPAGAESVQPGKPQPSLQPGEPLLSPQAELLQPGDTRVPVPQPNPTVDPRSPRRWLRWAGGITTAAAALALALGLSFPTWAGAVAGWPLIGPVVTEIIMDDAGMKWAYEMGLMQGSVAELSEDGVTIRILGVVADSRRTTVLYQVQGAPPVPKEQGKQPIQAGQDLGFHRPTQQVEVMITAVDGQGGMSSSAPPEETPLGLVGTVSTLPLPGAKAELELQFRVDEKRFTLTVPASRAETDRYSREVAVNQSQEIDGITYTVESVTYTPVESIVRLRLEAPSFYGPIQRDPETEVLYLEADGVRYRTTGGGSGVDNVFLYAFPRVKGSSLHLVVPLEVKGVDIDALWPLQKGAVTEVLGVPVTLASYQRQNRVVQFEWESPDRDEMWGVSGIEVIDREGRAYEIGAAGSGWSGESNYVNPETNTRHRRFETELPEGVEPVAVRATRAAVPVEGPWVFELPQ